MEALVTEEQEEVEITPLHAWCLAVQEDGLTDSLLVAIDRLHAIEDMSVQEVEDLFRSRF